MESLKDKVAIITGTIKHYIINYLTNYYIQKIFKTLCTTIIRLIFWYWSSKLV